MKTLLWTLLLIFQLGLAGAQPAGTAPRLTPTGPTDDTSRFTVTERGPHHRVWERVEWVSAPDGKPVEQRHRYVELATGLHFQNERGEWEEAQEQIEILPNNAGAAAMKGQHKVIFPPEITAGLIEMQTPEGQWLRSRVWGLAYFDVATGESVLLAEVKASVGQLVGSGSINYPDAFTDLVADITYVYTKSGFEQNVVFRECPPAPQEFDLNPETTQLQVLTEFVEAPLASVSRRQTVDDGIADDTLIFGATRMGAGKAFSLGGAEQNEEEIPVGKRWEKLEKRDFLIESIRYERAKPQLQRLPPANRYEGASLRRRGQGESVLAGLRQLLPKRYARREPASPKPQLMARVNVPAAPGFIMDYATINSSLTNFTFKGDTTYYLSGAVYLYGTNVLEGNTVLKYAKNASLQVQGAMRWETTATQPAMLIAKDDNSAGETISGSTGDPSGTYALYAIYCASPSQALDIHHTRIRHAANGITVTAGGGATHRIWDCQFWHVSTGVFGLTSTVELENALFHQVDLRAIYAPFSSLRASHLTVHRANAVLVSASSAAITNSLLVWVTNWPTAFTSVNNATNNDSATFQAVGAGAHYLAANSSYRNVGTTNISQSLREQLRTQTTYAPLLLTNTITTDTVLTPQAARDTDAPDLGYHYAPLDYLVSCPVTNATLRIIGGTVIGYYDPLGFWLQNGARLISTGTPTARNQFVYYSLAQECPVVLDASALPFNPWHSGAGPGPELALDFTTFRSVQGVGYQFFIGSGEWNVKQLEVRHCEFFAPTAGVMATFSGSQTNLTLKLINNLFVLPYFWASTEGAYSSTLEVRNNLFVNNSFAEISDWENAPWIIKDNVFDGGSVYLYGGDLSHNAYLNGTQRYSDLQTGDLVVTNFQWASGPLGGYYQSSTNLVNQGSRTAAAASLYHFTTQTNQTKEAASVVDMGYHYVAVDGNGKPLDYDSDGLADYLEDANGNGSYDTGDWSNWTSVDTDGDGISDGDEITFGLNPLVVNPAVPAGILSPTTCPE